MSDEKKTQLAAEFASAINRLNVDTETATPDYVLAGFAVAAIEAFAFSARERCLWHGLTHKKQPQPPEEQPLAPKWP